MLGLDFRGQGHQNKVAKLWQWHCNIVDLASEKWRKKPFYLSWCPLDGCPINQDLFSRFSSWFPNPQQKIADKGSLLRTILIDKLSNSKYMGLKSCWCQRGKPSTFTVYRTLISSFRFARLKDNKQAIDKSIIQLFCDIKLCPRWHCFYIHLAAYTF